jgi:acyl-CoA thioester hydrolase
MSDARDTEAPKPALAEIRLAEVPIAIRWRDLDAFGHVNNSTYLTWLEEARLAWLARLDGAWHDEHAMPVLAAAHVNYRRQLGWPGRVLVQLECSRVGTTSITIAHRIVGESDRAALYADGDAVVTWVDPSCGKPVALPEAIRRAASGDPGSATT